MNQTYQEKVVRVIKTLDTVALVYGLSLTDKTLAIEVSLDNVESKEVKPI